MRHVCQDTERTSSAAGHQGLPRYTDSDAREITRMSKMGVLTGIFSDYVPLLIEG